MHVHSRFNGLFQRNHCRLCLGHGGISQRRRQPRRIQRLRVRPVRPRHDIADREVVPFGMLLHVLKHLFGNGGEGLEHALSGHGDRPVIGDHARVQGGVQFVNGQHLGQIALVILQDHGKISEVNAHVGKIIAKIRKAFEVCVEHGALGIGDEDNSVGALQH